MLIGTDCLHGQDLHACAAACQTLEGAGSFRQRFARSQWWIGFRNLQRQKRTAHEHLHRHGDQARSWLRGRETDAGHDPGHAGEHHAGRAERATEAQRRVAASRCGRKPDRMTFSLGRAERATLADPPRLRSPPVREPASGQASTPSFTGLCGGHALPFVVCAANACLFSAGKPSPVACSGTWGGSRAALVGDGAGERHSDRRE